MKILVTGGAGFIGSNLIKTLNLAAPSTQITVLDDLSTGLSSNLSSCVADFRLGSILDYPLLRKLTEDAAAVVHLAAIGSVPRSIQNPRNSHEANATGTLNVLEAAREAGTQHVIVASSSSVYGANTSVPKRESDWIRPMSPYAVTKLATESYALSYAYSYGLKVLPFRFFNVYGPQQRSDHDYAAVIPRFVSRALEGRPIEIFGDGLQTRDFTFVDDVCEVIVRCLQERISSSSAINLAFGGRYSLLDLVQLIEAEVGTRIPVMFSPPRPSDVRDSSADDSLLNTSLPKVSKTDLREGLRKTIRWFETLQQM